MAMKTLIVLSMIFCAINADVVFLNADDKCPKWTCNSDAADNCLVGKGTKAAGRTITTNPCKTGNECDFKLADPLAETDVTEACKTPTTPTPVTGFALPGEACTKDGDCKKITYWDPVAKTSGDKQTCTNNLCVGNIKDETCKSTDSCVVGTYCSKDSKCAPQLEDAKDCTDDYACQNASFCFNGKCTPAFSQKVGTKVDPKNGAYLCVYGSFDKNNICSQTIYDTTKHSNISSGLVQCNYNSDCNYLEVTSEDGKTKNAVSKKCVCPYNAEGQGYCDRAMQDSGNSDIATKFSNGVLTLLNNGLHTYHRGMFGPKSNANMSTQCLSLYNMLYYKSGQCATNILSFDTSKCNLLSSGILKASIAIMGLVIALLFN